MSEAIRTQGLLFDMDGVLISSIGSVRRSWRRWAALYDVPGAETFEVEHGRRAREMIHQLRPDIDPEEGLRVIEDMEVDDVWDLEVLAGARELLRSLPPERWTIVTSATKRLLVRRLEVAGLPVPERLITADMVTNGKPHPEPYMRGAELLGLAPKDCIVVEDAPAGVGAGKAAGCRVLAVLGTHSVEELHEADWVVRSLEGVRVMADTGGLELRFTVVG